MDKSKNLVSNFHGNPLKRFILWSKGFRANKDELPNLMDFENNLLNVEFQIAKKMIKEKKKEFLVFMIKIINRYIDLLKKLEDSFKGYQNFDSRIIINPEKLNKFYHEEHFKENQKFFVKINYFFNKEINPFLNELDLCIFEEFEEEMKEFISVSFGFITRFGINGNIAFKCFSCIDCFDCGERVNGIKDFCSLEKFLENIIEFKIKKR